MQIDSITVGADPEVFFCTDEGKVLPAQVVFDRLSLPNVVETASGSIIVDGAALEFQPLPSNEVSEVVDNLRFLIGYGANMSEQTNTPIVFQAELEFDTTWCIEDSRLAVFGCAPDKSAWGEGCRPATIDASKHPWRYAGCHIHIGIVDQPEFFMDEDNIILVAKALDRTVGLASMVIADGKDARRRQVYGRPGVFRPQPWGMEYRTPSNLILRSPTTMEFIFGLAKRTVELAAEHVLTMAAAIPDEVVVSTLRGDNINLAAELYRRMELVFGLPRIPMIPNRSWQTYWFEAKRQPLTPIKERNDDSYIYSR